MRVLVVIASILLWNLPSLADQKSPDGFGKVKFGMTQEEAWQAIGGQGEWQEHEASKELIYELELRQPYTEAPAQAKAHHFFTDRGQGAGFGYIESLISTSGERCGTWSAQYASLIQGLFGVPPLKDSGRHEYEPLTYYTSYVFGFSNGVSINVVTYRKPINGMPAGGALCELFIEFLPPGSLTEMF